MLAFSPPLITALLTTSSSTRSRTTAAFVNEEGWAPETVLTSQGIGPQAPVDKRSSPRYVVC
jgi:hypothetical protein